jgi:hypothetical protein
MFQEDYLRIVKTIEHPSRKQAEEIVAAVFDRVRVSLRAMIVEVWLRTPGRDGDILRSFVRRKDMNVPETEDVALHENATGLLVYVAEKCRPIWLEELLPGLKSAKNRLPPYETIEGRYLLNVYDRTRAFAAIPIKYRDRLHAIISVESAEPGGISDTQIDLIKSLVEPTLILTWKADVFQEVRKHTDQEIDSFRNSVQQQSEPINPYRTGFLARPFDHIFDPISNKLTNAFRERGIRFTAYEPRRRGVLVITELLAQLSAAHFGVADISGLNENVLIELGAMIGTTKPTMIIRDSSEREKEIPFNIEGYQQFLYEIRGQDAFFINSLGESIHLQETARSFAEQLQREGAFRGAVEWHGER